MPDKKLPNRLRRNRSGALVPHWVTSPMGKISAATRSARSRRAVMIRHHGADHPATVEADAAYREALFEDRIRSLVADAPDITVETRMRLAALMLSAS